MHENTDFERNDDGHEHEDGCGCCCCSASERYGAECEEEERQAGDKFHKEMLLLAAIGLIFALCLVR